MPEPDARTERLDVPLARWLVAPAGRAATVTARRVLDDGGDQLAAVTALRSSGLTRPEAATAMSAAEAARRLPAGLAARGDLVFTRSALEQASDPEVAAWRARRFVELRVADAGCGAGSDLLALADHARTVIGLDRDEARVVLADHNVRAAGAAAHVGVGDALRLPTRVDAVHADPSRRVGGRRARSLSAYGPPVAALVDATAGADLGIAVSPAVSWSDPDLPADAEVEFVQRGPDLVEAMLWLRGLRTSGVRARATILAPGSPPTTRTRGHSPVDEAPVGAIGQVLIDVAPALVRARLHDELAAEVGAWRLARNRALLTTNDTPPDAPWYRWWHVETVLAARPRTVRAWLREGAECPIEIATAGMDADPEAWWRELGRPPRGPGGRRILLVRLDEGSAAVVLAPRGTST